MTLKLLGSAVLIPGQVKTANGVVKVDCPELIATDSEPTSEDQPSQNVVDFKAYLDDHFSQTGKNDQVTDAAVKSM